MSRRVVIWMTMILGAVVLAAGLAALGMSGQDVRDENGIRVVRNPKNPVRVPGEASRLVLTEELTIGRSAGNDEQFFSLQSVQADSEGKIYALDPKAGAVKVFDPRGRFLMSIGKKGQGPGEFSLPTRMILTPANEVAVMDALLLRISFFAMDGKYLRQTSTSRWGRFGRFGINHRGETYADRLTWNEKGASEYQLMKLSPGLSAMSILMSETVEIKQGRVIDAFPRDFVYGMTRDGGLAWALVARYEITVLDLEGKVRQKILKPADPNPMTAEGRKIVLRQHFGDTRVPKGLTIDFPPEFPAIRSMIVTDTDHILVRTYVRDAKGGFIHDVFDPHGRFISQFSLGEQEFVMTVINGKAYTMVREDKDGIPLVKRYQLELK